MGYMLRQQCPLGVTHLSLLLKAHKMVPLAINNLICLSNLSVIMKVFNKVVSNYLASEMIFLLPKCIQYANKFLHTYTFVLYPAD